MRRCCIRLKKFVRVDEAFEKYGTSIDHAIEEKKEDPERTPQGAGHDLGLLNVDDLEPLLRDEDLEVPRDGVVSHQGAGPHQGGLLIMLL